MDFKKSNASVLRQKQKELIDDFIIDTDKISKIMKAYTQKRGIFHNYSLGNLILATYQMLSRGHEEGIELLAPFKRWNKINRHVKKGEKAIYILAPIHKKIYSDENPEEVIETKVWFKKVPVFDMSQTEGEPFEKDLTVNNGCSISFNDLVSKINIPILESDKMITKGYTDGNKIWISKHLSETQKICTLFHELGHYYLHFGKNRKELTSDVKELEAESISFMITSSVGIINNESGAYITNWAGENSKEMIKGRGEKLIKVAIKIIDDLDLNSEIIDIETNSSEEGVMA